MDAMSLAVAASRGSGGVDGMLQTLLLRRLETDPGMRGLLPLLGIGAPDPPALLAVPDGDATPAMPVPGPAADPETEVALADALEAITSCQALLAEVATTLQGCVARRASARPCTHARATGVTRT